MLSTADVPADFVRGALLVIGFWLAMVGIVGWLLTTTL